jgi:hypothetical protein
MSELILHQFAASPFSEKIRWVLAIKGFAYKSVSVPVIMPNPDAVSFTWGYGRATFLIIGADIYCVQPGFAKFLKHFSIHPVCIHCTTGDLMGQGAISCQHANRRRGHF